MSLHLAREYQCRLAIERQIAECAQQLRAARAAKNKKREKSILRRLSRLHAQSEQWTIG